jgi:hypothetical protein
MVQVPGVDSAWAITPTHAIANAVISRLARRGAEMNLKGTLDLPGFVSKNVAQSTAFGAKVGT